MRRVEDFPLGGKETLGGNKIVGVKRRGVGVGGLGSMSALGLLLAACGGSSGTPTPPTPLPLPTDTDPPTLTSRVAVVSTPDGEAEKRALTLTFSEDVRLKDFDKIKLVRTSDGAGEPLTIEETVIEKSVTVGGKIVVVTFTPLGKSRYKVVIGDGAIEDEAGNGFVASGDGGTTEEIVPANTAPVFGDDVKGSVEVSEKVGGVVGTYGASDGDEDTLTYTLDGVDKGLFKIDRLTGVVSWETVAPDYVAGKEYKFVVVVVDGFGGEVRHEVTVTVLEVTGPLPTEGVRLYAADAAGDTDVPITGFTNKANLTVLRVKVSEDLAAGDSVEFLDGETSLGVVTLADVVAKDGDVTLTLTNPLSTDKTYVLTAKVTIVSGDNKGVSGSSAPLSFTLDLTPPAPPTFDGDSVLTNKTTPTVTVTGLEEGSRVNLYADGDLGTVIGTGVVGAGGNSVQVAVNEANKLGEDTHRLVARAVDEAGNESEVSAVLSVRVDLTAPGAPTLTLEGAKVVENVAYTKADDPVFVFSGLASDVGTERKLYVKEAGGNLRLLSASIDGAKVTVSDERFDSDGTYTVVGRVMDVAGNESRFSAEFVFTVDKTLPNAPTVVLKGGGVKAETASPTLTLSGLEVGGTVIVTVDNVEAARFTAKTTTEDRQLSGIGDGNHSVVVRVVDIAGNEGPSSGAFSLEVEDPGTFSLTLHSRTPEGLGYSDPLFEVSRLVSKKVALYRGENRVSEVVTTDAGGKAFLRLIESVRELKGSGIVARELDVNDDPVVGSKSQILTLSDIDTTKPTSSTLTATVDTTYLTLTFSEALGYSDKSAFTVTGESVHDISIDGSDLRIQLDGLITEKAYTVKWATGAVADRAGNEVEAKTTAPVTASASTPSSDTDAPTFSSLLQGFVFSVNAYYFRIVASEKIEDVAGALIAANLKLYTVNAAGQQTKFLDLGDDATVNKTIDSYYLHLNFGKKFDNRTFFTVGQHYRLWINAGVVKDAANNTNEAFTFDFIYESEDKNVVSYRGVDDVLLSTTGDEGLSVVDARTLRVNFQGEVKRGYDDRIVIEKRVGENYEKVTEEFLTSFSGKGLTLTFEDSLEVESSYRVTLGAGAVKESASGRFAELTTETEEVDLTAPTLDTGTSGGLVVGGKFIRVYFSETIKVVDADKIKVEDSGGNDVAVTSVKSGGNYVDVETTTASGKTYKVVFEEGGVTDGGEFRNDALSFVGETDLEDPVSGTPPKVTKIFIKIGIGNDLTRSTVTVTFDKDIEILDSSLIKVSVKAVSGGKTGKIGGVKATDNTFAFIVKVDSANSFQNLSISLERGAVSLADDDKVWNEPFGEVVISYSGPSVDLGDTVTKTYSLDDGDDGLLGLSYPSDSDYGF